MEQNTKIDPKKSFFKISKNKKMRFFLISQGSFSQKNRFLGQKVCSLCSSGTDGQSDRHESENRGHSIRVSAFVSNVPSTYHQRAVPYINLRSKALKCTTDTYMI